MAISVKTEQSSRISITFPADLHASLEMIAKQKKVSVAWVVREAADKYVSELWPLFQRGNNG